jgi:hypothetical protein
MGKEDDGKKIKDPRDNLRTSMQQKAYTQTISVEDTDLERTNDWRVETEERHGETATSVHS